MKTEEEIRVFLEGKSFSSEDTRTIRAIIKAKNYNGIDVVNGGIPNSKLIDFIDWFEGEETNDNQNVITFRDKKYEFIESKFFNCCDNCDMRENIDIHNLHRCNLIPQICTPSKRQDKREGYFKLKEQELELIPNEFYYYETRNPSLMQWIFQKSEEPFLTQYLYCMDDEHYSVNHSILADNISIMENLRIATPEEQRLFKKQVGLDLGKIFNEETKTFEDKPKDILVPENIKIVCYDEDKKDLGILFNEDEQVLNFDFDCNIYLVNRNSDDFWTPIACKLIKTHIHNLKSGDIFYIGDKDINNEMASLNQLHHYAIYINKDNYVTCNGRSTITENNFLYDFTPYQLIPID